ncbi:MAG: hypothetical protein J6R40_06215 [Clostridia bacterium]|nr:hypothetical protein [Clostridia bacterium]
MTDSDIIKAAKRCCYDGDCDACAYTGSIDCRDKIIQAVLDLIKRQQAEIERLTAEKDNLIRNYKECAMEAVRDFAERLKATFPPRDSGKCTLDDCYTLDKIDEIVAEMEG